MSDFLQLLKKYFEYDYRSAKTEKLRADLNRLRRIDIYGFSQRFGIDEYPMYQQDFVAIETMIKAIKAELSNRPNVPNKKQSKEIRRQKAKQRK